jgi:hypothetical protein
VSTTAGGGAMGVVDLTLINPCLAVMPMAEKYSVGNLGYKGGTGGFKRGPGQGGHLGGPVVSQSQRQHDAILLLSKDLECGLWLDVDVSRCGVHRGHSALWGRHRHSGAGCRRWARADEGKGAPATRGPVEW